MRLKAEEASQPESHSQQKESEGNIETDTVPDMSDTYSHVLNFETQDSIYVSKEIINSNTYSENMQFVTEETMTQQIEHCNEVYPHQVNHSVDDSAVIASVSSEINEESKLSEMEEKCMAVLSYISKFKLTGIASEHLIRLLKLFAPRSDKIQTLSTSNLGSLIDDSEVKYHDVCKNCNKLFPKDEGVIRCANCNTLRFQGSIEKQNLKRRISGTFFVTLSLRTQLKDILERNGVFSEIVTNRQSKASDITSGSFIQEKRKGEGFLKSIHNLSLAFNTDGVPLYNSSSVSIWPVYLVINELPAATRFSQKNMLIWGLWQSTGKPKFQTFLQRFIEDLRELKDEGVAISLDGQDVTIKAELTVGTMDLQAKAYVMEMTQHNGQFGCLSCEEPGTVCKQGKGHARGYPLRQDKPAPNRTVSSVLTNAEEALESGKACLGIKDVSVLFGLPYFDPIKGLVPDYMHGVLLGTTKKLLQLWFSSSSAKEPYHLGKKIQDVDVRLMKMKPTNDMTRMPRKLESNLSHLKASELQNWLLHFSVPCLDGIMELCYMENLCFLVEGIHILLGDTITQESLVRARDMLGQFYSTFEQLYGTKNCGLNIHNIGAHLVDYVAMHGPLWAWSCFPFEDMNGLLVKSAHGTGDVCRQLLCLMKSKKKLLVEADNIEDPDLHDFTNEMLSVGRVMKNAKHANNCKILGGLTQIISPDEMVAEAISQYVQHPVDSLYRVLRIQLHGHVIYSKSYRRMHKRISHVVLFQDFEAIELGSVLYFVYEKQSQLCFAVCEKLKYIGQVKRQVRHILKVEETKEVHIVPVQYIAEKVLFLGGNESYSCISRMPNLNKLCS